MAFHSYPQLIRKLFNAYRFGPPVGITQTSTWSRVDHSVSRLPPRTMRPLQTRFRFGYVPRWHLTSHMTVTRRFIMQKARRHTNTGAPTACRRTVSGTISLLCLRCFSPFPHGTGSLSVSRIYLALPDGPGRFTQDFTCPALLRIHLEYIQLANTRLSRSVAVLSSTFFFIVCTHVDVLQPPRCRNRAGLGCSPCARHY